MLHVDLILFDLDGTLLDTRQDIAGALNSALRANQLPEVSLQEVTQYIGSGVQGLIKKVLNGKEVDLEQKLIEDFYKVFKEQLDKSTQVFPQVKETLKQLKQKKVIVTNKSEMFTGRTLKAFKLESYFEDFYSRETFLQSKPSPVPCVEICKKFGVRPEKAVIVGDTPIDLMSGQSAGLRTVGVLYGYTSKERLLKYAPDFLINTFEQLLEVVK
jgi:phosphoglycolate phosphatase